MPGDGKEEEADQSEKCNDAGFAPCEQKHVVRRHVADGSRFLRVGVIRFVPGLGIKADTA